MRFIPGPGRHWIIDYGIGKFRDELFHSHLSLSLDEMMAGVVNVSAAELLIWWKPLICDSNTMISSKVQPGIGFICKWQHEKIILHSSQTCELSYFLWELSNIIPTLTASLIREAFLSAVASFFLHSAWYILDSPWFPMGPMIILYSDALIKLMCWFYVFNLPWSPTIPAVPLPHSSEDPPLLWSQSPVKGLKRLNSWWLLGPLWFTLSTSPCPLSKFTTPKWGALAPSFPSQRCFQVPPIGCRSCKP